MLLSPVGVSNSHSSLVLDFPRWPTAHRQELEVITLELSWVQFQNPFPPSCWIYFNESLYRSFIREKWIYLSPWNSSSKHILSRQTCQSWRSHSRQPVFSVILVYVQCISLLINNEFSSRRCFLCLSHSYSLYPILLQPLSSVGCSATLASNQIIVLIPSLHHCKKRVPHRK